MGISKLVYSDVSGICLGVNPEPYKVTLLPIEDYPDLKNNPANTVYMSEGEMLLFTKYPHKARKDKLFSNIFTRIKMLKRPYRREEKF